LGKVDGFILKNRSPSCGFTDVKFYSGPERGPAIGRTAGLFGGAVLQKFRDLAVEDEGRLKNLSIREHFLTRIFALARLRKLQQSGSMHSLERFHSLNHLLLMAYSQTKLSELEKIVASAARERTAIVLNLYARYFREAFGKPVRRHRQLMSLCTPSVTSRRSYPHLKNCTSGNIGIVSARQDAIVQCREHNKILGHKIQINISVRTDFL
jgi:hypothetical protein